ncbi:MAG TPA: OmpH family outer membrane protein [Candidatus Coprenecus pullicola]|nr:OmpH family outer membrane protein [Candidatus Coprenecus pullicola]
MKKVNLILNIVLVLAVAALYVLHFTGNSKTENTASTEDSRITAGSGDIVYINLDTLVNQYDMYNDLRTELESKVSAIDNDLNKKGRALENDAKSFEEKMQKGLLTYSQAESMRNDLMTRDQELRNLSQQKQMELANEESVMYNRVMDAIKTYVDNYNKEKQYSLILTTTAATNSVINGEQGRNITNEIINGLNQEYIKNRNK